MFLISLVLLTLSPQLLLCKAFGGYDGFVHLDLPNVAIPNTVIGSGGGNIVGNQITSVDGDGNVVANIQGSGNNVIGSSNGHGNVLADIHGNGLNIINGVVVGITVTTTFTSCPHGVTCTGQTLTWTATSGTCPCTGLPCIYVLPNTAAAKSCNNCTTAIQTTANCNGTEDAGCTSSEYYLSTTTVTAQTSGATSNAKSTGSNVLLTQQGTASRLGGIDILTGTSLGVIFAVVALLL